ncbi:MAG: dienelactone hydrolase family protein [Phycisphaerales bacterium]|nr:dienelactone hydrolase family protein [Phycisphaerales bacterium]
MSFTRDTSMAAANAQSVTITLEDAQSVSGLLQAPPSKSQVRACYVLAHGAGAGMAHPFMAAVAQGLADREIATLRYQFPYMERHSRRPDTPKVAQSAVRAAVEEASRMLPNIPLFAGGKSFGGRMTSQAQAASPMPGMLGLAYLGFPLHPPGKPSDERAQHLFDVQVPMLFLQGTRDDFAELNLLQGVIAKLGARAALKLFQDADHSFHVPARSGRKDSQVQAEMLDALAGWIDTVVSGNAARGAR